MRGSQRVVMICGLHCDRAGNVALVFALFAPLLLALVGAGVDYGRFAVLRAEMQEIADAAAIAGARQYLVSRNSAGLPDAVARNAAEIKLEQEGLLSAASVSISTSPQDSLVDVEIAYALKPTFLVGMFRNLIRINVKAEAQAGGSANICVIGLNESATGAVRLSNSARLTGADCAVFSNSTSASGLIAGQSAKISSALSCSSGGYDGASINFDPLPLTDCPKRADPLADRSPPPVGPCDYNRRQIRDFRGQLQPGVYCGGLTVDGASNVDFADGVYVMKNGPLTITGDSVAVGDNVGFYFTGAGASLTMSGAADISLSAPVSGPMAGILVWQDAATSGIRQFAVMSDHVRSMVGTIYLPKGAFRGSSNGNIAEESAYTAIIADSIELSQTANLVLNSNYGRTSVPVPGGLAGAGGRVMLRQ